MDDKIKDSLVQWLDYAYDDLRTAKAVLNEEPPITNTACFHAQQCAEKALKAYQVKMNQHVERIHDLAIIVKRCIKIDISFNVLLDIAEDLTDYAVSTRYPDDFRVIPLNEAHEAVEQASKILEFVKEKLRIHL